MSTEHPILEEKVLSVIEGLERSDLEDKSPLIADHYDRINLTSAVLKVVGEHLIARMNEIYRDGDGNPIPDGSAYEEVEQLFDAVGAEDRQRDL